MPAAKAPRSDSVVLTVRLTPAERDLLDKWAAEESRTLSSLIRSWIAEKASGVRAQSKTTRAEVPTVQWPPLRPIEALEGKCSHPKARRLGDSCPICGATGLK